ncbi:MAG: hypothetical protein ACOY42_12820 [Pseudomonadota bacterium]
MAAAKVAAAVAGGLLLQALAFRALLALAKRNCWHTPQQLLPAIRRPARLLLALIALLWLMPALTEIDPQPSALIRHGLGVAAIGAVTWLAAALVDAGADILRGRYDIARPDNLEARRMHTQLLAGLSHRRRPAVRQPLGDVARLSAAGLPARLRGAGAAFVSQAEPATGIPERLGLKGRVVAMNNTRAIGKADMVLNDYAPRMKSGLADLRSTRRPSSRSCSCRGAGSNGNAFMRTIRKRSGIPLNLARIEADGRPITERAGDCSEQDFGSMGTDAVHAGPVRLVRDMRKCSVFKRGRFPDTPC